MMYMPQPSTPDKLHGEPWDFHSPTPGALYGAIGSGLPSNAANQPYSQSSYNVQVSTTHLLPPPPVGLGKPHMHNEVWSRPSSGTTVPSSSSLTFTPPPPPPPPILPVSSVSHSPHPVCIYMYTCAIHVLFHFINRWPQCLYSVYICIVHTYIHTIM